MQNEQITITSLYKALQLHGSVMLTCETEVVPSIRKRLAKRKYSESKKLGEFADTSLQLAFKVVPIVGEESEVKLYISLRSITSDEIEGIAKVELPVSMEDVVEGKTPVVLYDKDKIEDVVEDKQLEDNLFEDEDEDDPVEDEASDENLDLWED